MCLKRYLFGDIKIFFHLGLFFVVLFGTDLTVFSSVQYFLLSPIFLRSFLFYITIHRCIVPRRFSKQDELRTLCHKVQSGELAQDVLRKNDLIRMFRFGRIAFGGAVSRIKRHATRLRKNWVIDPRHNSKLAHMVSIPSHILSPDSEKINRRNNFNASRLTLHVISPYYPAFRNSLYATICQFNRLPADSRGAHNESQHHGVAAPRVILAPAIYIN